jgi:hypothetical protein
MCPTGIPGILSYVGAQGLHIAIDVVVTGDEIRGQVCDGVGQPKPFSGWLGLIGVLDGLLDTGNSTGYGRLADCREVERD